MSLLLPLVLLLSPPAEARRPQLPAVGRIKVPSIEEVVAAEGFTPTPSQSEIYKPGAVLVPNGRGGHDVVVSRCIDAEPDIALMSQSSIATTLAGGVSARLGIARGAANAGIEKRLSFVDPEQRTISLGRLNATEACSAEVQSAGRLLDLSSAIVLHDVLVAIIKNSVCTKADAGGGVVLLGEAEAASYSECVQESDGQVPLGYKAVPLSKVLAVAPVADIRAPPPRPVVAGRPAEASASVDFGTPGGLGLDLDAQLAEQACVQDAQARGAAARVARLAAAEQEAKDKAATAWRSLSGDLDKCVKLPQAQRGRCVAAAEQWLSQARAMPVSIPAGVEPIETACGPKQPAFAAEARTVVANEVAAAEALLVRLEAPDRAASGEGATAWVRLPAGAVTWSDAATGDGTTVSVSSFELMKTEVTVAQYRTCVEAGACTEPRTEDCNWGRLGRANHPVDCVTWHQASAFAAWAGGRLPSRAEWIYAATSGGKSWDYPWGDEPMDCSRAIYFARGCGRHKRRTSSVCSRPKGNSIHGVCDLVGNLEEWTGSLEWETAWVGGGSWGHIAQSMDAVSYWADPSDFSYTRGFRLAR